MYEFISDYGCRTVGEAIGKYGIPNDWIAEFDAYDSACLMISTPIDHIRETPALMELKLRIVENEDEEYAGCMIYTSRKTVTFKIDSLSSFLKAIEPI